MVTSDTGGCTRWPVCLVTDNFILYKSDTCRNDVFTSLWVFDSRNLCMLGKSCTTELQLSLRVRVWTYFCLWILFFQMTELYYRTRGRHLNLPYLAWALEHLCLHQSSNHEEMEACSSLPLLSLPPNIMFQTPGAREALELVEFYFVQLGKQSLCLTPHMLSSSSCSRVASVSGEHQILTVPVFKSQNTLGKCKTSYPSPCMIPFPSAFYICLLTIVSPMAKFYLIIISSLKQIIWPLIWAYCFPFPLSFLGTLAPPASASPRVLGFQQSVYSHGRVSCFLGTV